MSSHRRTVFLRLLALISILLGSVAWAGAASASSGYIEVQANSASSPADNVGLLSLNLASDMPITGLTVTIVPEGGGTPLLSLPMSDFTVPAQDGTGYSGTWTLTSPITTTQLPLGSYEVDVTATSADASISDVSAGTLNFLNVVEFPTFTSSGTSFNYFSQQVTFSGTATIMAPGGTAQPFANQPVTLTNLQLGTATPVTTGSDGSFTTTVTAASGAYWMTSPATSTTASASSAFITITVTPLPVTMQAALAVTHADYGQADQVNGTLTYSDHGVATPLTNTTVTLYLNTGCCGPEQAGTTVTNASGQFTLPIDTKDGGGTWSLKSTASAYFASGSASVTDTVAYPVLIRKFHASLNAFAVVQIQACVVAGAGKVEAQYAAKPGGPWHNLGPWKPRGPAVYECQIGTRTGVQYLGTYSARLASAYYRVVFSASNDNEPAVSPAAHLSRLLTKITSFSVTPRTVSKGGHFTVRGRLWKQGQHGTWSPYGGRRVIVVFRYQGTWYRYRGEPKTSRLGWFSGRFVVYASSPVFAQYNGDATHFACTSKRVNVHERRAGPAEPSAFAAAPRVAGRWPAQRPR